MKLNRRITKIFLIVQFLSLMIFIACNVQFVNGQFDVCNLLIWLLSSICVFWSIQNIKENNINACNIFMLVFFFFLHLNTYKMGKIQIDSDYLDLYYYFLAGVSFISGLFVGKLFIMNEKKNVKKIYFSTENIVAVILIIYLCVYLIIFKQTGIRLFSKVYNNINNEAEIFVIPGLTGLASMLTWLLLFYLPHVKKIWKVLIIMSTLLLYGVMMFSRGNIMRIFVFCVVCYMCYLKTDLFTRKNIIKFFGIAILSVILFALLGTIRQSLRWDKDSASVIEFYNNEFLNINIGNLFWIWGYTIINFDVIKMYYNFESPYQIQTLVSPLQRFVDKASYEQFLNRAAQNEYKYGLGGFNASTFLTNYIIDLKEFFFIEVFILGVIVGIFTWYAWKNKFIGIYSFILTLIILMIFGDYFMNPNFLFTLIFGCILLKLTVGSKAYK